MMNFRWTTHVVAVGALVTWIGCSRGSSERPPAASQGGEATPVEPSDLEDQSDEEILAVLTTVAEAEIRQGELALERAQSPQVRAFAGTMVQRHSASKDEAARIATTNDMTVEAGPISRELNAKASDDLKTLSAADAATFAEVYLAIRIERDREFLSLLNGRLLPDVDNEALLHQLQAARDSVADQLGQAERLAAELPDIAVAPLGADQPSSP